MAWNNLGVFRQIGVVVVGLAFTTVAAAFVLKWAPEWLAQPGLSGKDKAAEVGRTRTAILAVLAGVIAVAGAIFTGLSYRLNRAGQITERFTRAIEQLGNSDERPDIRLGGVYALERIALDSKDDHPQVVEVLTAYVREHARYKLDNPPAATTSGDQTQGDEAAQPDEAPRLATDVQAVMDVLARRDVSQDRPGHRLNLAHADLRRLVLDAKEGGHLEGANLYRAHLDPADLSGAHLERAILAEAHLERASLIDAHLEAAHLLDAHLEGAYLSGAHLGAPSARGTSGLPASSGRRTTTTPSGPHQTLHPKQEPGARATSTTRIVLTNSSTGYYAVGDRQVDGESTVTWRPRAVPVWRAGWKSTDRSPRCCFEARLSHISAAAQADPFPGD